MPSCLPSQFQCTNPRVCIPRAWLCDRDEDCTDASDEANCSTSSPVPCTGWVCNSTSTCIPSEFRCNGLPDCIDESDEIGCPTTSEMHFDVEILTGIYCSIRRIPLIVSLTSALEAGYMTWGRPKRKWILSWWRPQSRWKSYSQEDRRTDSKNNGIVSSVTGTSQRTLTWRMIVLV